MSDTLPDPTASFDSLERAQTPADAGAAGAGAVTGQRHWALIGSVVLALVALLACVMLWQKVTGMQEQLARQSAEAQAQSLEARALAKQAESMAQETVARVGMKEARMGEEALQRSQLEEKMLRLSRSRDENLLVDIEATLRLAQQQSQLTGSVEPMLAALRSAEQRITRAAQPRMAQLQRVIVRDIERIKSATVSDLPAMLAKLDELVRLSDQLALANAVATTGSELKPANPPVSAAQRWWDGAWQQVLNETRNLVRVSRIDLPEAALLSPEQSFFVRENFKLKLLNARLGFLARQNDSARADLAEAGNVLKKYFDAGSRKTQTAAALLQQLQVQMGNLQLPRMDDSLAALAAATAGR